ncbi:MAG: hypothetical protein EPN22_09955 [Nitrospirae bacterium]|nr:MAG: hypothetical protein EPN22_09955 [Nitrospirota bacterium]
MSTSNKKINRLTSASMDFDDCIKFLDALQHQSYSSPAYEALLISAIIFYVRPFSENEKKNSINPSDPRVPDSVLSELSPDEHKLHDRLKKLRNKAIAHAEWSHHPTGVTASRIIKAMPFSIWKHFRGQKELQEFISLVRKVRRAVQLAQTAELRKLP